MQPSTIKKFCITQALSLLAFIAIAPFVPQAAQASMGFESVIAGGTKLQLMCANCHVAWGGGAMVMPVG